MAGCKSCAKQAGLIPKAVDPYTDDEKVEILGEAISTALRKAGESPQAHAAWKAGESPQAHAAWKAIREAARATTRKEE